MPLGLDNDQRDYQLSDLLELVKENKLQEIKDVLWGDRSWTFDVRGQHKEESADYVDFATKEAILSGNIEAATTLFNAGVYINGSAYEHADKSGHTDVSFLQLAISTGNLDMVKLLVERGATVKQQNSNGNNYAHRAIAVAIEKGNAEIAAYLFDKGADPDSIYNFGRRMNGMTYLAHAARLGHTALAEAIIRRASSDVVYAAIYSANQSYVGDYSGLNGMVTVLERAEYEAVIKSLLDLAPGQDFCEYEKRDSFGLPFLKEIRSVAGFNFIGVSLGGKPVTPAMLKAMNLVGVDDAIFTFNDIFEKVTDVTRRHILLSHVNKAINARIGEYKAAKINCNDVINLVPLAVAAETGDIETVKARLAAKVDPNEQFGGRVTQAKRPIVEAAKNGHIQVVDVLVNHRDIDVKTLSEAIRAAQDKGFKEIAELIADHQNVNELDAEGNSLLHYAVEKGDVALVAKLIAHGADVNLKSKKGYPLIVAVREIYKDYSNYEGRSEPSKPHLEIMHMLLAKGADPNLREPYIGTALEQAGESACMEAFNVLLPITTLRDVICPENDDKYNPKKNFPWYTNIMHEAYGHAAGCGNPFRRDEWKQLMMTLKEKGADFNQQSIYGRSLLEEVMRDFPSYGKVMEAERAFQSSMGDYSKDAIYRQRQKNNAREALHDSQKRFFRQLATLDFMLDLGADPSRKYGQDETTALHTLIGVELRHIPGGYARVIDRCIRKGFDINTADKNGNTLLHLAADGREAAVKYLLSRGANTNLRNKHGRTPLFLAAGRGFGVGDSSSEIVKLLIQHGADVSLRDNTIQTAAEYAVQQRDTMLKLNAESFKMWDKSTQIRYMNSYQQSLQYLANPELCLTTPKTALSDDDYIRQLRAAAIVEPSLESIVNSHALPAEEFNLVALYLYDMTGKYMANPVRLREAIYDLDTLLATVQDGKGKDPATGLAFSLADIEPADDVRQGMIEFGEYIKEKFPAVKNSESVRPPMFMQLYNMFGGSQMTQDAESEKKVRMGL